MLLQKTILEIVPCFGKKSLAKFYVIASKKETLAARESSQGFIFTYSLFDFRNTFFYLLNHTIVHIDYEQGTSKRMLYRSESNLYRLLLI